MGRPEEYDVVVAGGGPAGAIAARCLARAGQRVLLADRTDAVEFKIGEGLPPAARPLLRDLDLWEGFVEEQHLPCYGNVSVWGSSQARCTDFLFDPNGHGWHLDRPRFDRFLRAAASMAGADVRERTVVRRPVRGDDDAWRLELGFGQNPAQVECRWLVDATGRRCAIARRQGGQRRVGDTLISLYARFRAAGDPPKKDRDARTLIEAVPDGWWYTVGDGWLAVGDAALSCDPLSSQGILTALYTGMIAGQALHTHLTGGTGALSRYAVHLSTIGAMYQQNRIEFYQFEQRWPHHPFWQRRNSMIRVFRKGQ